MSVRVAPDVCTGLYVPVGPTAAVYPRPYYLNHRLAEGVYL